MAPVCGACPALLSVDAPSVQCALRALWLKPDSLHREGCALGRRIGASARLKDEAHAPHLWLFSRTGSIITRDCGRAVKSPEVAQKFDSLVGAAVMEMQRWSLRWKTKRWIMDSTLTAFITLFLVLQAASVRAGKLSMVSDQFILTEREKHDLENSVTDDGDRGIKRFTWKQAPRVSL